MATFFPVDNFLPNETSRNNTTLCASNSTDCTDHLYGAFYFDWVNIVEIACLAVLVLIAIPSNGLLLLVKYLQKNKTTTDYLILTLAGFDLFCAGFAAPVVMVYSGIKRHSVSAVFCKIVSFSSYLSSFGAALLICGLAVDRFIVTILPLNVFYDTSVAKKICVGLLVMNALLTSPSFFLVTMNDLYSCNFVDDVSAFLDWWHGTLIFLILTTFVVIIFCYSSITIMLKKRNAQRKRKRSQMSSHVSPLQTNILVNHNDISLEEVNLSRDSNINTFSDVTLDTHKIPHSQSEEKNDYLHINIVERMSNKTESRPEYSSDAKENQRKPKQKLNDLKLRDQATSRITLVLFTISVMYMVSWTCASIVLATNYSLPKAFTRLSIIFQKLFLVSNPLLYIFMSSKFKQSAKKLICGK